MESAVKIERDLRALEFRDAAVIALEFEHDRIVYLEPEDRPRLGRAAVDLASSLAPGISAPTEFAASLTASFRRPSAARRAASAGE